jgi:AbrB family looped-hinge helix DNA binding protein
MEKIMKAVTVSSKFQVVIPREVRESMDLQPGTRVQVLQYGLFCILGKAAPPQMLLF